MNRATDEVDLCRTVYSCETPTTERAFGDGEASRDLPPGGTTLNQFRANIGSVASCALFASTTCVLMARATTTRTPRMWFTRSLRHW